MELAKFYKILEEIAGTDLNTISNESILKDLEGWDSLAVVQFIAMTDEQLGVMVPAKQIAVCTTVADLVKLLGDKVY